MLFPSVETKYDAHGTVPTQCIYEWVGGRGGGGSGGTRSIHGIDEIDIADVNINRYKNITVVQMQYLSPVALK